MQWAQLLSVRVAAVAALALACAAPDQWLAGSAAPAAHRSTARILFQAFTPTVPDTLFTMRPDGSDLRQLPLDVPGPVVSADWAPDGRHIVFVVQQPPDGVQSIWMSRADGTHAHELLHCGSRCSGMDYPAWSPDGASIAFTFYNAYPPPTAGPPARDSIRVLDLSSGRQRVVAGSSFPRLLDLARWAPDGNHLVAQQDRFAPDGSAETGSRLVVVAADDGDVRPLTDFPAFAFHPDWGAQGKIVYASFDFFVDPPPNRASNIFTIRPDGSHQERLTHLRVGSDRRVAQPTFTSDGRCVLFTRQNDSGRRAAIVAARGGPIRIIPDVFATHPRLSPTSAVTCPGAST
jgi:Tol biopolymer transport system component